MQNRPSSLTSRLLAVLFHALLFQVLMVATGIYAAPPKCTPESSGTNGNSTSGDTDPGTSRYENKNTTSEFIKKGWYTGWDSTPENFPYKKYTHLAYAFALVNSGPGDIALNSDDLKLLPEFVKAAKDHGVKASLSIGGWTGSKEYSTAVATAESRKKFVQAILELARKYQLDGIDLDWEYPNHKGIGCNSQNPQDTENFLSFLKELKSDPEGQKLSLSAAVHVKPFLGPDGTTPVSDVSQFGEMFDHIAIMGYDISGPWDGKVGPNAPLNNCGSSSISVASAVEAWTKAGFPKEKIVLAVAAYGHSFGVPNANYQLYEQSTEHVNPKRPAEDKPDVCGQPQPGSDVYYFSELVSAGYLNANGAAASGVNYNFDSCSQTPFIYIPELKATVSYDDPKSFEAKGNFIRCQGLKGYSVWPVQADPGGVLVDAIGQALSKEGACQ